MKFRLLQLMKNRLFKTHYKFNECIEYGINLQNKSLEICSQVKNEKESEDERKALIEVLEEYFLLYS